MNIYYIKGDMMKGIVLIMDGMGDRPIKELDNKLLFKPQILQIWIEWLLRELLVLWIQ